MFPVFQGTYHTHSVSFFKFLTKELKNWEADDWEYASTDAHSRFIFINAYRFTGLKGEGIQDPKSDHNV